MAITYEWQVNTMERDISDGFVNKVIYRVKGLDDGTEKARVTGEVKFTKPSSLPSDFKAYDSLSESICLAWVKDTIVSEEVTAIETSLTNQINLINTPTTATGKPW
tara:strand:- start:79 stop:396 length:318 start_codon:yes stop_codon:yes gene_type:complete